MGGDGGGPDFFCIGMQKAGTRWLYDSLRSCPGFWMPPIKELHFFDRDFLESDLRIDIDADNLRRCHAIISGSQSGPLLAGSLHTGMSDPIRDHDFAEAWIRMVENGYGLEDYRALFRPRGSCLSGDFTPAYSALSEREIQTVRSAFPGLKVVLIVRDPAARAWSSFTMYMRRQVTPSDKATRAGFIRAIEKKTTLEALVRFMALHETRQRSFPSVTYHRWASVLGKPQVHVAFFQDIISRPAGVIEDVCSFLGVALGSRPFPAENVKEGVPRTPMTDEHRAFLNDYFREEFRALCALFPKGAAEWGS